MNCNTETTRLNVLRPFAINVLLLMIAAAPIAASDGYTGGYHATGVEGDIVYLNDLEDHTWSYYQPNGGIDASYEYPAQLCSPDPRNVKITYIGNGVFADNDDDNTGSPTGVQVSISESENTFIYYETHGTVFGGGNRANVIGTPTVTVTGSDTRITGNVFGGGNQGDVTGSPVVTVGGTTL